jgi:[ribosomal protein S5]-alanine N-acetyltransferase
VLQQYDDKLSVPHVILDDGRIVGRVTLSNIVRGPFQSCNLGYWVSQVENGRGMATTAVGDIKSVAFVDLDLHRIEAGTLLENIASQRVLERNGFIRFEVAPGYLNIAGTWQDHAMYQALNPNMG